MMLSFKPDWRVFVSAICCCLLWLFPVCSIEAAAQAPQAQAGKLDLETWPLAQKGPVALNGAWHFHWQTAPQTAQTIRVPGRWEQIEKLPLWQFHAGTGIYRLKIALAASDRGKIMQLNSRFISTSFQCFWNGELMGQSGRPLGQKPLASRLLFFRPFEVKSTTAELECRVSNHDFHRSGLVEPLYLGLSDQIQASQQSAQNWISLALGCVFFLAFYHLILFVVNRNNTLALWFGLTALCAALYYDLLQYHLLEKILDLIAFGPHLTVLRLALYTATIFLCFYLQALFPEQVQRGFIRALTLPILPLLLITLIFPARWHTLTLFPFWLIHILQLFYMLFVMIQAARHQVEGAWLFVLGTGLYIIFALNDMLFNGGAIHSQDLVVFGYVFFCLCQSSLLAIRFNHAFSQVKTLAQELQSLNLTLEQRVAERTSEIAEQNEKIQGLSQFKENLTQMLIHDLKNPLTVILAQRKQGELAWQRIYLAASQMQRLILNLLDVSRAQEKGIQLHQELLFPSEVADDANDEIRYLAEQRQVRLLNQIPPEIQVRADRTLLQRIFVNLLSNALNHGPVNSSIVLSGKLSGDQLELKVTDQGAGIEEAQSMHLFEKFESQGGGVFSATTGLGLTFCRMAVEAHKGSIGLKKGEQGGTSAWFVLPEAQVVAFPMAVNPLSDAHKQTLSAQEIELLKPFAEKMRIYGVFEISRLNQILKELEPLAKGHEAVYNWIKSVKLALNQFDQERFQSLMTQPFLDRWI
jgi:signal transduction histidine kinase